MSAFRSKTAFLYGQIRRGLQSGRYAPGQRIDPATLAAEFKTSPTPVRSALFRLVGEGQLADYPRGGLHVPLPNELTLRDLYDWMQRLLLMACDIGGAHSLKQIEPLDPASVDYDLVKSTWQLFDQIALGAGHWSLHHAVKRANDRLAPIRRAKHGLVDQPLSELVDLQQHWQRRDMPALKAALRAYHQRRKLLVPRIVAALSERGRHPL